MELAFVIMLKTRRLLNWVHTAQHWLWQHYGRLWRQERKILFSTSYYRVFKKAYKVPVDELCMKDEYLKEIALIWALFWEFRGFFFCELWPLNLRTEVGGKKTVGTYPDDFKQFGWFFFLRTLNLEKKNCWPNSTLKLRGNSVPNVLLTRTLISTISLCVYESLLCPYVYRCVHLNGDDESWSFQVTLVKQLKGDYISC